MAGVVDRFGERDPHQPGRGHGAVEPRQRHHVDDGRDAAAKLADQEPGGAMEFGLGGGVGAVAELVLEPHVVDGVPRPVREEPRHQEAGETFAGAGKHQKRVAHRRRHEPLVAGDAEGAVAGVLGLGGVGVDVAAALLLRHPHADGDALLLGEGAVGRIVLARPDLGEPDIGEVRRMGERGHGGAGHGHRADMAGLGLDRHVEGRCPRHAPHARLGLDRVPDRGMEPRGDAFPHQRMIGRVELDDIDANPGRVVGPEERRRDIGDPAKLEGFAGAGGLAMGGQAVDHRLGQALDQRPEAGIAQEQVHPGEGRRLVENLVRVVGRAQSDLPPPGQKPRFLFLT